MDFLKIVDLSLAYETQNPILSNVNFTANRGELIALVGRNGSGKSTFIKALLRLISPLEGQLFIDGMTISHYTQRLIAQKIAVLLSHQPINPSITAGELLILGRYPYYLGIPRLSSVDRELIDHVVDSLSIQSLLKKSYGALSDGQKQMVMLGRVMVQDTPCIVLDEPTTHLDVSGQYKVFEHLCLLSNQLNKLIILSSHQLDLVAHYCSSVVVIDQHKFIPIANNEPTQKKDSILSFFK